LLTGNGGYEFHFVDKDSSQINPGDALFLNARVGYAAGAFLPYLGVLARFRLDGTADTLTLSGGQNISLEPGLVVDIADWTSLQLGIPFAVLGKRDFAYWALHLSLAVRLGLD
jgi:hypothetical protein